MAQGVPDRIYLTGFMGSGKSTIAPLLARIIGYGSVDIDTLIEDAGGKTITEIFSAGGEKEFRRLERAALLGTTGMEKVVVSLGGGTLAFGGNDLVVRSAGMLVYLRVDQGTLFSRVRDSADRPLLRGPGRPSPGPEELKNRMEKLFAERAPFYEKADLVVDAGDRDPGSLAEFIAAAVAKVPRRPGN